MSNSRCHLFARYSLFIYLFCNPIVDGWSQDWIGFTRLQTNVQGGRHANVATMRAMRVTSDGTVVEPILGEMELDKDSWTQFAGWSPTGDQAIVLRGWEDPDNAQWEEEHRTFRFDRDKWRLDILLVDLRTGASKNLSEVERVSHYNSGLYFLPHQKGFGFTALVDGVSKPFVMEKDGRSKRSLVQGESGFIYGYSSSPDGKWVSYHDNYQIYVSKSDGTDRKHIATGNSFNFGPQWSPDSQWLLILSGKHGQSHPYVVRPDGSELKKVSDLQGYQSFVLFLDVDDYHQGSSDLPIWSSDGKSIFYTAHPVEDTAEVNKRVEIFQVSLNGEATRWTHSDPGTLHYHLKPSADGRALLYGSKRAGVRQLFVLDLESKREKGLTRFRAGEGGMWADWQPNATR